MGRMVWAVQSISSSKDVTAFDFIELSKRRAGAHMRQLLRSCKGDTPATPRHKLLQRDRAELPRDYSREQHSAAGLPDDIPATSATPLQSKLFPPEYIQSD